MASYETGLNFSSDEIVAIYTAESTEEYITVTADRQMTVPEESYLVGIEGDHNSNPVRFSVERYVDGADLLECNAFYIAWQNSDAENRGTAEMVFAVDSTDPTKINAIWLVDYTVCAVAGALDILLRAVQTNSDGEVVYEWQTFLNSNTYVEKGINDDYTVLSDDSNDSSDTSIDSEELEATLEEVLG